MEKGIDEIEDLVDDRVEESDYAELDVLGGEKAEDIDEGETEQTAGRTPIRMGFALLLFHDDLAALRASGRFAGGGRRLIIGKHAMAGVCKDDGVITVTSEPECHKIINAFAKIRRYIVHIDPMIGYLAEHLKIFA